MFKKTMILLGTLVVATSLCLAQDKTDQKPAVKSTPIKQTKPDIWQRDVHAVLRSLSRP